MRPNDYPPPSYAGHIWWAQRRIWLATGRGGFRSFEDTPQGLAQLRIALLDLADQRATLSAARDAPSVRLDASGKRKLDTGDLWETPNEETGNV